MRRLGRIIFAFFLFALALLFVLFAIANRDDVVLSFFPAPYTVAMPKFIFLLLAFGIGVITGGMMLSFKLARHKQILKREKRRANALENEVKALRMETSNRSSMTLLS